MNVYISTNVLLQNVWYGFHEIKCQIVNQHLNGVGQKRQKRYLSINQKIISMYAKELYFTRRFLKPLSEIFMGLRHKELSIWCVTDDPCHRSRLAEMAWTKYIPSLHHGSTIHSVREQWRDPKPAAYIIQITEGKKEVPSNLLVDNESANIIFIMEWAKNRGVKMYWSIPQWWLNQYQKEAYVASQTEYQRCNVSSGKKYSNYVPDNGAEKHLHGPEDYLW